MQQKNEPAFPVISSLCCKTEVRLQPLPAGGAKILSAGNRAATMRAKSTGVILKNGQILGKQAHMGVSFQVAPLLLVQPHHTGANGTGEDVACMKGDNGDEKQRKYSLFFAGKQRSVLMASGAAARRIA